MVRFLLRRFSCSLLSRSVGWLAVFVVEFVFSSGFVFVGVNQMLELMDRVATVNSNNPHKCCLDRVLETHKNPMATHYEFF